MRLACSARYDCVVTRRLLNLFWIVPLFLVAIVVFGVLDGILGGRLWLVWLALFGGGTLLLWLYERRQPKRVRNPSFLDWIVSSSKRPRDGTDPKVDDEESLELFRIMSMVRGDDLQDIQAEERKAWGRTFEDDVAAGKNKEMIATNPVTGERWNACGRMDDPTKPK